ncbi:tyrosine-type recombinase/integrase [Granulicella sp. WH15]|uniref:tyrosine-type recombinase/integrase n=1 Tax=Granulicella sp. WH15 TaxID=2602070 RepID=UPI0013669063|nr:tyrosine-type recombinase/integrase [Granulicella sp. WH15]QHN02948.1 tyrosine-type recombinase/integrase [Granulicella sp. WH15]
MRALPGRTGVSIPSVPLVTIFVRHSANCPHKSDHFYRRCNCRKSLRYFYDGKQKVQSAKTRSWIHAEEAKRELEDHFRSPAAVQPPAVPVETESQPTIGLTVQRFLGNKKTQGLTVNVLQKYERELGRFAAFMTKRSHLFLRDIESEDIAVFREGWQDLYPSPTTRSKVQDRLKTFLWYCYETRLIDRMPQLLPIRVRRPQAIPLSEKQFQELLQVIPYQFSEDGDHAQRVRAFILLIRHSGLFIHDLVKLQRDGIQRDMKKNLYRVTVVRQNTGTSISIPIPPAVAIEVIAAMESNHDPKYVFGNTEAGRSQTSVTDWKQDIKQVFKAAGHPKGRLRQLRDTFAVSLLERGVPLEEVSLLLGHKFVSTTERIYGRWVKARQDRLDALVSKTWEQDPSL